MAEQTDWDRLRRDIGATEASLPNEEADAIFAEAAETYPTPGAAQSAQARVIALRGFLGSSAKLVSYRENASSEDASDVFEHLSRLLTYWESERDKAASRQSGAGLSSLGLFTVAKAGRATSRCR